MIVIVSAASQNYSRQLARFIETVYSTIRLPFSFVVYDLGDLPETYKTAISKKHPSLIWQIFDYSKYPEYYNIHVNAGEYAWKSACIYDTMMVMKTQMKTTEDNFLLWCDAGNFVAAEITELLLHTKEKQIYSPYSNGVIRQWTHPKVLKYFGIDDNAAFLNKLNRNGAIMCFYVNNLDVQNLLEMFYSYSQIKNAICPEGSNRSNHRQDQALFSILYHKFMDKHKIEVEHWYKCIMFHYDHI